MQFGDFHIYCGRHLTFYNRQVSGFRVAM